MPKMTMAQALVRFLDNQYVSFDGKESKFVEGIFTIFGHGIVCRGQMSPIFAFGPADSIVSPTTFTTLPRARK